MFSFSFLNNPSDLFLDRKLISNDDWLINNIGNHNAFSGSSFLYNILKTIPSIIGSFIFIFAINFLFCYNSLIKLMKNKFQMNFIIGIYLGIYFEIYIITLGGIYFDNINFDFFNIISQLLSWIFLIVEINISIILILILYKSKKNIRNTEIEYSYGILFEGLKIESSSLYYRYLIFLKIQILLTISFIFQFSILIQLLLFTTIYTISLFYHIFSNSLEFLEKLLSLIREFLFLSLCVLFFIYSFGLTSELSFLQKITDILLLVFVVSLLKEFAFCLIIGIISLVSSLKENSIKANQIKFAFRKRQLYIETAALKIDSFCIELLKHHLTSKPKMNKLKNIHVFYSLKSKALSKINNVKSMTMNMMNQNHELKAKETALKSDKLECMIISIVQ